MFHTESSPVLPANTAWDIISSVIARLQIQHTNVFMAVSGDFNHAANSATLLTLQQFGSIIHKASMKYNLVQFN